MTVWASEEPKDTYSQQFVTSTNSPVTLKIELGEFLPTEDGYCVSFVKAHGFEAYSGNAGTWSRYVNSFEPSIGAAIVLSEGKSIGHLALVLDFDKDSIYIVEQNFIERYIVSYRTIPRNYNRIIGFVSL